VSVIATYPRIADEPGLRLGIGSALLITSLLAAGGLQMDPHRTLVLLLLVIGGSSVRTTVAVGAALGGLGWGLYTGFVVNRYGELTFGAADLTHLLLLVAAGVGTATVTAQATRIRANRPRARTGVTR
jgi:hypothetical protein